MAPSPPIRKPLRVLLSEGSSTSAREAITILGLAGHIVEVCDPSPFCLSRFSRFLATFHRCPGLRDDPYGFLAFVERLITQRRFDVLLPIHEQGLLFARARQRSQSRVAFALPSFESYRAAHCKAGFSRILSALGLPQPSTQFVKSEDELRGCVTFPCVIKTSVGTASRGVWLVRDVSGLELAIRELRAADAFADEILIQHLVTGATEKAQAVFCDGRLIGFHAYRQIAGGAGGGDAIKLSVHRAGVRDDLATIGEHLAWHGALSIDYIWADATSTPLYIDCNPRLVEPMSAYLAGVDLVVLLLEVSQGRMPAELPPGQESVRTHQAMQALLGSAIRGGTRRGILRECFCLMLSREPYANSREELTPLRRDWISAVPLCITALTLLVAPKLAQTLAAKGWGPHLLDIKTIRAIARDDFC